MIINNLLSGLHDGSIFDFIRKLLCDGDEVVIRSTNGITPIDELLGEANSFDAVVASGGDGTIAAVCYALRYSSVPILPFPAGTGNLLAMNLDQPEEPYALVNMVRTGLSLQYDLAELSFDYGGATKTKGFIVIAGGGFDAMIMEKAERLKSSFGPGAYPMAALSSPSPKLAKFNIELDDQTIEAEGIAVLVVNFAKIMPDISITADNDARDGLLEIVVLKPRSTIKLLPALISAFLDRAGRNPRRAGSIETYKSKTVRVTSTPNLHIQYDGEAHGAQTPFTAKILPGAARLIVTEEQFKRYEH